MAKPRPSTHDRKLASRLYAVQALFQMEASGQSVDAIAAEFKSYRFGEVIEGIELKPAHDATFNAIVERAVQDQAKIDQATDRAIVAKWHISRIDPTLRALFRAAGAEMLIGDTPARIVITSFMTVAEGFFPEGDELKFTNAVLDHMARELQPEPPETR